MTRALLLCLLALPAYAGILVTDGDTVRDGAEKIRLLDIDTPELRGKCDAERRLAVLAMRRLEQLLSEGTAVIERHGKGRYGRTLARITVNGRDVGQVLVSEGYARRYDGGRKPWCN